VPVPEWTAQAHRHTGTRLFGAKYRLQSDGQGARQAREGTPKYMANILVIDDDMQIVQMLKSNLEDLGHRVTVGFDGQMAISLGRSVRPDLIIMDVNMPMTNGVKALEFLRKAQDTAHIPVLFLTSADSNFVFAAVQKTDRAAYIKKPVDLEELNSMASMLIQKYAVKTR
jgi:DNA-binding response OmpR family regulator